MDKLIKIAIIIALLSLVAAIVSPKFSKNVKPLPVKGMNEDL